MSFVKRMLCGLVIVASFAVGANAIPVVDSTATFQGDNTWLYEYNVTNEEPTIGWVYDVYVPILGSPIDVFGPDDDEGWFTFFDDGFVEWVADFGYEIQEDETVEGFGFTSYYGPLPTAIEVTLDDEDFTTFYIDGLAPSVIPEPATLFLFASGVGAILVRRRRRVR